MTAAAAKLPADDECPACGRANLQPDARFCGGCGEALPSVSRPRLRLVRPADAQAAQTRRGLTRVGQRRRVVTSEPILATSRREPDLDLSSARRGGDPRDLRIDDALLEASGLQRGRRLSVAFGVAALAGLAALMMAAVV